MVGPEVASAAAQRAMEVLLLDSPTEPREATVVEGNEPKGELPNALLLRKAS